MERTSDYTRKENHLNYDELKLEIIWFEMRMNYPKENLKNFQLEEKMTVMN